MIPCVGSCSGKYCHGSALMSCSPGMVFNAGGYCNWASAEGCAATIVGHAAARSDAVERVNGDGAVGPSALAIIFGAGVALFASCAGVLAVRRQRRRTENVRSAPGALGGDTELSEVAMD